MKLTQLETAIVSLPLPKAVITPIHHIDTVENVLVTLRTADGLEGVSYLWALGARRAVVLEAMVWDLFEVVRDRDPRQRNKLWDSAWQDLNFLGRGGVGFFALSALDTAITDIAARAVGEPAWRYLGGSDDPVPIYAGGLFLSDSISQIEREAVGYVERGFRSIKMRVGNAEPRKDVERVKAVRDAIGPDIRLMVDVVQGWEASQAIARARMLEPFDIYYIEDPVPFDEIEAMASLAHAIDIPIAAGENNYGRREFLQLIKAGAAQIPMIDLQRAGGITEWLRIASLCDAHCLPVVSHVFHEISVHLAAAAPNTLFLEYVPWWEALFEDPIEITNGTIRPPDKPGLGLCFNRATIEAQQRAT